MVRHENPNVYVVDSHANRPPIPSRLGQRQRRAGVAQTLLILLVSVALCGMTIEACFIYRLYFLQHAASASSSKLTGDEDVTSTTESPSYEILPSKPVAHLTGGSDVVHGHEIMAWSMIAEPILYGMVYSDRSLIIQKEGFYYVYSKVFFMEEDKFYHSVEKNTDKYPGKSITLQRSRKYTLKKSKGRSNSYLGGVFHLCKDDALFVKVSSTAKIQQNKSYENVFGAFMI
ncbi:tumor necrosis factor ligand superfamily member 14 [Platichthys flesus]|uniref:tumor necrosis factor ligand superfamily member 14 n=1 Tax=Platichthys flesus TaxID=8260 RepID=UPI002DB85308|nr:tumor necrosis factor ligand superfamily member 14 [Platichthys flesus]